MSFGFMFRDLFLPPKNILAETGISPGMLILDYGCGPGSYSITAAEMVGEAGKVYALDIHPLAIQSVKNTASKKGLKNIEFIHSDCDTDLPGESIDIALLYDTYHNLTNPNQVLEELHRILKPDGILSFRDHHLPEDEIDLRVTEQDFFRPSKKGRKTYSYVKGESQ
ncbi:MAG: class I SAM-dependent methyltransferase [Deltaproteobacteria bacterium]|nr:class I SAM-dependent methyltransferase [Deltaproteobacteria bacterium]MBW2086044.1 class I SAM-dependent methyltransferase [Deltaproteobacteria bacterium]